MKYYVLKISLNNYEDRLNRKILFPYNQDLDTLAFTTLSIFNTLSYHLYMFKDDVNTYECDISIREAEAYDDEVKSLESWNVTIDMLKIKNSKFKMIYDFGVDYEFIIGVEGQVELDEVFRIPRVIDGKGYGIVEDDKDSLERFLNGETLEYPLMFIKRGRYSSVDFELFDLEECNKKLKREISKIRNSYLEF